MLPDFFGWTSSAKCFLKTDTYFTFSFLEINVVWLCFEKHFFLAYIFNVHRYKRTQWPIWHKYGNFPNCLLVTHKAKTVSSEPEHKHYKIHRYVSMYWNVSKYVNIYQNVSKMHQNISECIEMYQIMSKCIKMYQNYIECMNIYQTY